MITLLRTSPVVAMTRILVHLRDPLYRNGYALIFSSAATSALGIFYWILANHLYTTETIGINSALLSVMNFVAGLAQLNLSNALNRFAPTAGPATKRLILGSYVTSVGVALIGSLLFLAGLHWWTPALAVLRNHWALGLSFVLGVMVYCIFTLQDGVLVGLREATWVPIENLAFAVAKLLMLALLADIFTDYGVYASWLAPMVITVLPVNWLIFRRLLPNHATATQEHAEPLQVANVARYVASDYLGSLIWTATIYLLPLIVLQKAGATASAYYYMAWTIAYTLYLIGRNMSMSLITEAVMDPTQLMSLSYRTLSQTFKLLTPLVLTIIVGAPVLLSFFGPDYTTEATTLLRLLALSTLPGMITTLYVAIVRIQRRMKALVIVNLAICFPVLAISYLLLEPYGSVGVGVAWLVGQSIVAIGLLVIELRAFWLLNINLGLLLHLLEWPRTLVWRWRRRQVLSHVNQVAPKLMVGLAPIPGLPLPTTWQVDKILHTVTDMTVALLGPPKQSAVAVLKLAQTPCAEVSLRRQAAVSATLRSHPLLQEWARLLPTPLAVGEIAAHSYLLETLMPGVEARCLVMNDADWTAVQAAAYTAIGQLHRQTMTTIRIDDALLQRWVDRPIATLKRLQPALISVNDYQQQLRRLQQLLRDALVGRTVAISWIHGDYAPGNILMDPESHTVTGLIDWELAAPDELSQLDLIQFFIATWVIRRQCEYGDVIRTLLTAKGWKGQEALQLEMAQILMPGEKVAERELVLLCWLRQVTSTVTKAEQYTHHRWWKIRNVEAVLLAL